MLALWGMAVLDFRDDIALQQELCSRGLLNTGNKNGAFHMSEMSER